MPPREQKTEEPATQEQIVILYGLLRETATLVRRVNDPLNSALFAVLFSIFRHANVEKTVLKLLQYAEEMAPTYGTVGFLVLFAATMGYSYYRLWQFTSSRCSAAFPNGIGFSRERHPVYAMEQKLGSKTEVDALIKDLRRLVARQRVSSNRWFASSLAVGIVAPFWLAPRPPSIISTSTHYGMSTGSPFSIGFCVSPLGPGLCVSTIGPDGRLEELSGIATYAMDIAYGVQRLPALRRIGNWWSNYDTPKQLRKYTEHLANLTSQDFSWQIVRGTETSKNTAVFSLDVSSRRNISLPGYDIISPQSFIHNLHRTFMAVRIPVFVNEDGKIYVGYHDLNPCFCRRNKTITTMQRTFSENTRRSVLHERYAEANVTGLNRLSALLKVRDRSVEGWSFYRSLNERGEIETHYYTSVRHVPRRFREEYRQALSSFVPATSIVIEDDILTISRVPDRDINFDEVETQLRERIGRMQAIAAGSHSSTPAPTAASGTVKTKKKLPPIEEEKDGKAEAKTAPSPYPTSIDFGGGVRFLNGETKHSPERAYPLHVPWLPEGRAYISIDARVLEKTRPFVPSQQVINRLNVGKVIGASKTDGTKAGTVGLQSTDQPYQTVDGVNVPHAFAKVKVDNFGFYARRAGTVTTRDESGNSRSYVHYRIDGFGLRH